MSIFSTNIKPDALRSLGFASISGTYANVGTVTKFPLKVSFISNTTDADMIISLNGGTTDHFVIPTTQNLSIDGSANWFNNNGAIPAGTQFAVKQVAAPTKGSVYVAGVYQ